MWRVGQRPFVFAAILASIASLAVGLPVRAQDPLSFSPSHCVFQSGDDPGWSQAQLDESEWLPISDWPDTQSVEPYVWLRCRITPAEWTTSTRPVLQVAADAAYEIYVDGNPLARFGNLRTGAHTEGIANQYQASAFSDRSRPIALAVRFAYMPTVYGQWPRPSILLGDAVQARSNFEAHTWNAVRSRWIVWLCNAIMAAAGLFFLTLYIFERSQRMLLWAGITWLSLASIRFSEFLVAASVHFPSRLEYFLYYVGNTNQIFYVLFFFALVRRPVNRLFRVFLALEILNCALLCFPVFLPIQPSIAWRYWVDISPQSQYICIPVNVLLAMAPLAAFWPIHKLSRSRLALFVVCSSWMVMDILYQAVQFPPFHFGAFFFLNLQSVRSVSIAAVVLAMTLLLIQQIRHTNRERAALAADMRAAQEIQRILVPRRIESAPGLQVEAIFLPAQDVGGDFYRFRVLEDGSQWMLLGDVSGKGAAAGMTGAMLLGACEGHTNDSPAALLEHLNRVLCESQVGGFATCLCARIGLGGTVVLANAGHLPPYLDGREIALENGLPLGLKLGAGYLEETLQLAAGNALTFLSDGVVEAQAANGELFGFDRTQVLSVNPAAEIAEAAQRFGQRDDITVLRVSFAGMPALALER